MTCSDCGAEMEAVAAASCGFDAVTAWKCPECGTTETDE